MMNFRALLSRIAADRDAADHPPRPSRTIMLFDDEPSPVGAFLLEDDAPVESTPARDCLLVMFPREPVSALAEHLAGREQWDFSVKIDAVPEVVRLSGQCWPDELLEIVIPTNDWGRWCLSVSEVPVFAGWCRWSREDVSSD